MNAAYANAGTKAIAHHADTPAGALTIFPRVITDSNEAPSSAQPAQTRPAAGTRKSVATMAAMTKICVYVTFLMPSL